MAKLTAAFVRKESKPGRYSDGLSGLMLFVQAGGRRSWVQRLTLPDGRRVDRGLGSVHVVGLAEARQIAMANWVSARRGVDPFETADEARTARPPRAPSRARRRAGTPTFAEAAELVIALNAPTFKDPERVSGQWRASFRDYANPAIGDKAIDAINSADVLPVLVPIWHEKRATAKRLRQRLSRVFMWGVANGYRTDDPAGAALSAVLTSNGSATTHHRALEHGDVRGALDAIRASTDYRALVLCFEWLTHTACRSGEARGATWGEIDLDGAVWTIPGSRTKTKVPHRVPLAGRAAAILEAARDLSGGAPDALLFPSKRGKLIADATLSKLVREAGVSGTPHGMRSAFRSWCADNGEDRQLAESALGHSIGNQVESAYFRTDMLERRRELMERWSVYIAS